MEDAVTERALYDPTELARLMHMRPDRLRRWLFGYRFVKGQAAHGRPPIIVRLDEAEGCSFLDLIEVRIVSELLRHGVSLQTVRRLYEEASELVGADHPMSRVRFYKLEKRVFRDLQQRVVEACSGGQFAIPEVVHLVADEIRFDERTGMAVQWWPLTKHAHVVLDPQHAFGSPIVAEKGMSTANVYDLYLGEGENLGRVCKWFNISEDEARDAIRFEESLLSPAA